MYPHGVGGWGGGGVLISKRTLLCSLGQTSLVLFGLLCTSENIILWIRNYTLRFGPLGVGKLSHKKNC